MHRRSYFLVGGLIVSGALSLKAQDESLKPNFILILADDLGWSSTSMKMDDNVVESKSDYYDTPNIERMAENGLRFSRGYASAPISSPTRRSIQYGQTPVRQGEIKFKENYHPANNTRLSIPVLLKRIDPEYKTAHYGKWDLRGDFFPEDIGYDESDGNTGNKDGNLHSDAIAKWTNFFLTSDPKKIETLTARAGNFMERQVRSNTPFYLQISHYATHVDIQANESTLDKYWRKEPGKVHANPGFAAMLEDLDAGIGKIIDKVYELGIEKNTYIIFMADNGGVELIPQTRNKMAHPSEYRRPRMNHPLRGGKWTLYEGGIRVPFIVIGPGITSGAQTNTPVTGWDLLPTIADLAGYEGTLPGDLDGGSFKEILTGNLTAPITRPRGALVFHRFNDHYPHSAIIMGDYKLIKLWDTDKTELYDLSEDIEEVNNLSNDLPEKVDELYAALIAYMREVKTEVLEKYTP